MTISAGFPVRQALQIVIGIVAGAAGAAVFSPHQKVVLAAQPSPATVDTSAIVAEVEARLNRRYTNYTNAPSQPAAVPREAGAEGPKALDAAADSLQLSAAESKRLLADEFATDLRVHAADARDPNWARPAEVSITDGLMAAHGRNFDVVGVDCKTSTCVATLRWRTREEANVGGRRAVEAVLKPNCESKILLHDVGPDDTGDVPFEEKLLLNCASSRAE